MDDLIYSVLNFFFFFFSITLIPSLVLYKKWMNSLNIALKNSSNRKD